MRTDIEAHTLKIDKYTVKALAVTPDGCHVVSGSSSGMLRVSDFATGKSKLILRATVPR